MTKSQTRPDPEQIPADDLELYDADGEAQPSPYDAPKPQDDGTASSSNLDAVGLLSATAVKNAPRNSDQAAAFLRAAHDGPLVWRALCLKLQRQARGLPAVYPSALSAALATPLSERVTRVSDLRRGMVAYSDDPNDSNPFGHVYYIAGWDGPRDDPKNCLTWTNDARRQGGVDLVPLSFFRDQWGDRFQFGATWLNGYNFAEFDKAPAPDPGRGTIGGNLDHAIEDIRKAMRWHRGQGNTAIVNALAADLAALKETRNRFPKP